jgi:hypothetical protein
MRWIWNIFNIPLFFVMVVIWDSMIAMVDGKTHVIPRRMRRAKKKPILHGFPSNWMVLTGSIMLLRSAVNPINGLHPNTIINSLTGRALATYDRVTAIDALVDLNTECWMHYQGMRQADLAEAIKLLRPISTVDTIDLPQVFSAGDEDTLDFIDARSEPTEAITETHFLKCLDLSTILDTEGVDWLHLQDLCSDGEHVNCVFDQITDKNAEVNLSPSGFGIESLEWLLSRTKAYMAAIGTPSFTISHLRYWRESSDFNGSLVPTPRAIGGMGSNLRIEREGTVQWTFKTDTGTDLTVSTRCYYVPQAKARLLSPQ